MSDRSSHERLLASDDSPIALPGGDREGAASGGGGDSGQTVVHLGDPPKDPDGDDQ